MSLRGLLFPAWVPRPLVDERNVILRMPKRAVIKPQSSAVINTQVVLHREPSSQLAYGDHYYEAVDVRLHMLWVHRLELVQADIIYGRESIWIEVRNHSNTNVLIPRAWPLAVVPIKKD